MLAAALTPAQLCAGQDALSADRQRAEAAVSALCSGRENNAAAELEAALANPHWQVRKRAVTCLGNLKARQALPAILKLTRDPNAEAAEAAFGALSVYASTEAAGMLRAEIYASSDFDYRKKAAAAAGRMNSAAVTELFLADVRGADPLLADRAAFVLVNMQTGAAVEPLARAAQTEKGFARQAARDALSAVSGEGSEAALAAVLASAAYDRELRLLAARSLSIIRSSESLAALEAFAADVSQPADLRAEAKKLYGSASMGIMRYMTLLMIGIILCGVWWLYRKGADL